MKPIKINYKDANDNRTSTTINGNIAMQYWFSTDDFETSASDLGKLPDDYIERVKKEVQKFVNEMEWQCDKDHIENSLIRELLARRTSYYIGLKI